jgi:hypothetical protein
MSWEPKSKKYKLNKTDLKKILKGLGIAVSGAVFTYGTEIIPSIDWGSMTPLVVAGFSVATNMYLKWKADNE